MRRHTNGGHDHVLGELWRQLKAFNADIAILYQHVSCKTMAGLMGLFDDQARENNVHLIWVEHDLMDPRTISRKDMRARRACRPVPDRVRRRGFLVIISTAFYYNILRRNILS